MFSPDLIVKKSRIHGLGVFAGRDFRKGEMVLPWDTSHILTKAEVVKLPKREQRYISRYGRGAYILHQEPERYVNHSCEANTHTSKQGDVAIRQINKGVEITADYLKEGVPNLHFHCRCGTKHCYEIIEN